MEINNKIIRHEGKITRSQREAVNGHSAFVIWITGLSGAGKSTLASSLEEELFIRKYKTMLLDGDNLRHGLCQDLRFSLEDRTENLRRAAEVSKLMLDAGVVVIAAFISPIAKDRELIKEIVGEKVYIEIYCKCSLDTCEARDPKGLYKSARAGKLINFTGIDSPYEFPANPQLVIDTEANSIEMNKDLVLEYLANTGRIPS
jgi:adenylylsulfate kinase